MADSEEEKDHTGDESDAEQEEQDDYTDTSGGEEDEGDEGDGDGKDDDKPVTKKDLLDFRKGITSEINSRFANRRHNQKNPTKPYKPDPSKGGKGEDDPFAGRLEAIEVSNAKRDFGYEHKLSPKEVDLVFKFANGKPTSKTLNHPFVKGGLEQLRASNNLRENTPGGSSSSSFEVEGKKWDELKPEEKQKNFAAKQKAILAGKGKR